MSQGISAGSEEGSPHLVQGRESAEDVLAKGEGGVGSKDLNEPILSPEPSRARDKSSRGDLRLRCPEVIRDLVPKVREIRQPIASPRSSQESNGGHVLAAIGQEVLLVEHHVVRDHRVIVQVHDVLAVRGQAMCTGPQGTSLVALRDENVLDLGVRCLHDLEGVVCWPVEVSVVADANILRRDVLQHLGWVRRGREGMVT
jgi:hypothetical protein